MNRFGIEINMIFGIFFLLVIFQVKHLVADYFLQGKYMLQKFKPDWGFFFPLLAHSGVHAGFTLIICLLFAPHLWWLAAVDLVVHFVIDRVKAGPKYLGKFKPLFGKQFQDAAEITNSKWEQRKELYKQKGHPNWFIKDLKRTYHRLKGEAEEKLKHNKYFWFSMGCDQAIHHLTHYYIIFAIIMDTMLTH